MISQIEHVLQCVLMVLWIAMIPSEVFRNYWRIEVEKSKPDYLFTFILRGFVALCHAVCFDPRNLLDWLPILLFQVSSFFIIFSPFLNIKRNKPFWYIGKDSGYIIDPLTYDKPWIYKWIYFGCVVTMILTIIVIYNRQIGWIQLRLPR